MPNWCNNVLVIKGNKEDLDKFEQTYKSENLDFDFEKIKTDKKGREEYKEKWKKLSEEEKTQYSFLAENEDEEIENYYFDKCGYYWNFKNWGTKWNAKNQYKDRLNNNELVYTFDTAWNPCKPLILLLIKKHPELEFNLEFEEWGECFMGKITGKNGEILTNITEDCEIEECPKCETTNLKPLSQEKFECGECGYEYTTEESEKAREERENVE